MHFNLVREPWIPVETGGGTTRASLWDLLATPQPQALTALAGDPPVAVALLRLLAAIIHDATRGPVGDGQWAQWWSAGQWPTDVLARYLTTHESRFDLFGEQPFGQDPRLAERPAKTIAELLPHRASGNNPVLWSHNTSPTGDAPLRLSPADAACWLLAEQQFSRCGIFPTVRGGKRSAAQPVLTNRAVTYPVGVTVAQTLLLNLVTYRSSSRDEPPWRRDEPVIPGPPAGLVQLLTWQTRNILLTPGDPVTACARTVEDEVNYAVSVDALERLDPHLSFRDTKDGLRVAVVYDPHVSLWRTVPARLGGGPASAVAACRRRAAHGLDLGRVRLETAGLAMASFAKPVDWVRAGMPVGVGSDVAEPVGRATAHTEKAASALAKAARPMLDALGIRAAGAAGDLVAQLWTALDRPGRTLVADLSATPDGRDALLDGWVARVRTVAHGLLHDVAAAHGPHAVRALSAAHVALNRALPATLEVS